jgi:hypothetical protein
MTTRRRPLPRSRMALRSTDRDVVTLWESKDKDPADMDRKVREFREWQDLKKRGVLPMYTKKWGG